MFFKIGILKNVANFTRIYENWNFTTLSKIKKRLQHKWFPVKFAKFLRTPFFTEHIRWLLLNVRYVADKFVTIPLEIDVLI